MQLDATQTDHISELLALVVAFTKTRGQVLANNIRNMDKPGFFPEDLSIEEFSQTIDCAISEYLTHERVVLRDTDTIRFGPNLSLELESVPDTEAHTLLCHNRQDYVAYQTGRLLENALNEKVAMRLLNDKEQHPHTSHDPTAYRRLRRR